MSQVLITGASSGIGAEIARQYAARGARLALFARRRHRLDEVAAECTARGAAEVLVLAGDTTAKEEVDAAARRLDRIDRAFLNAGGYGPAEAGVRAVEWSAAGFTARAAEDLMRANYLGVAYWLEALLPIMRGAGGTIAVTGAQAADRGYPLHGPYAAAKAATRALVDSLRADAGRFGVTLCLIEPGCVESDLTANHCCDEMPFLQPTDRAVAAFIAGVEAGRPVVRWPRRASWLSHLAALAPRPLFDRWALRKLPR
jgi:NADP-dependent 3-hydroxy acid dehydrogenase YdfG